MYSVLTIAIGSIVAMINGGVAYALGIPAWIAGTIAGITLLVIVVLLHALAGAIDEME